MIPALRERDHPRIRGEHAAIDHFDNRFVGSSPHTRGALCPLFQHQHNSGIIPAYAGSTSAPCRGAGPMRDHPRIRGEHYLRWYWTEYAMGSSPHTRGALIRVTRPIRSFRIIPAYAGSTIRLPVVDLGDGDHPRIRGEHKFFFPSRLTVSGSSPHTRGAPILSVEDIVTPGIIPAYAGSTILQRRKHLADWDHPRIRGEHQSSTAQGII